MKREDSDGSTTASHAVRRQDASGESWMTMALALDLALALALALVLALA